MDERAKERFSVSSVVMSIIGQWQLPNLQVKLIGNDKTERVGYCFRNY